MDIRALDRAAMKVTGEVVGLVRPEQMSLPTPCADWTLYGLLRHLLSENLAFAAATTAEDQSTVDWNAGRLGPDPITDYDRAAATYLDAFEPDSVLDRRIRVGPFGVQPVPIAVCMHFIDTVVHGWDVAKTIGATYAPDEELAGAALKAMKRFPPNRPNAAFDVQAEAPAGASELDQLVAFVGRQPAWSPA